MRHLRSCFAGSHPAVMIKETLRALYSLQEIDTEIFRVQAELARLPEERSRRRVEIDRKIAARDDAELKLRDMQTRIKEIEDLTTIQRQRQRKLEGEAAQSRGDAAVLAAFQHEIRSIRKEIGEAEDEGLQLVETAEEYKSQREALQAEIDELEGVFAEYGGNVEKELGEAQARLEDLQARRRGRMTGDLQMKPDIVGTYNRLIQAREGVAMAVLNGRICQGCYMEVPPNIFVRLSRGTDMVQCPSCDRILFLPEP